MFTLTTATGSLICVLIKSEQGKQRSMKLDNLITDKEVLMVAMTHEQELSLERFADIMTAIIERHANEIDKAEMNIKLNNTMEGADKTASSFLLRYFMNRVIIKTKAVTKCPEKG